ncbi:MAG: PTS sugar transporter subunit IIA, partial [Limnohabitans sp.]
RHRRIPRSAAPCRGPEPPGAAVPSGGRTAPTTQTHTKLVAGVNLPMLLRTVCYRHENLDDLTRRALDGGTQGVIQLTRSS